MRKKHTVWLFRCDRSAADFVGAVADHAQVHDGGVAHVRLPVVQGRLEVVREPQAQVGEFALADQ